MECEAFRVEDYEFASDRKTNMNIIAATKSYEDWMRRCTDVIESDLRYKHQQMREDPNVDSPWTSYYANLGRKLFKGSERVANSERGALAP